MTTYFLNDSGTRTEYTDHQDLEDAVRDALFAWSEAAECPKYHATDAICCANHPTGRFNPCPTCVAVEKAIDDDQAWLEGGVGMPYEIRLPGLGNWLPSRHIRAWEN